MLGVLRLASDLDVRMTVGADPPQLRPVIGVVIHEQADSRVLG